MRRSLLLALAAALLAATNEVNAVLRGAPSASLDIPLPQSASDALTALRRDLVSLPIAQDPAFASLLMQIGVPVNWYVTLKGPNPNENYEPTDNQDLMNLIWTAVNVENKDANGVLQAIADNIVRAAEDIPTFDMPQADVAKFAPLKNCAEIFANILLIEAIALGANGAYGTISPQYQELMNKLNDGDAKSKALASFLQFIATDLGQYFAPILSAKDSASVGWALSVVNIEEMLNVVKAEVTSLASNIPDAPTVAPSKPVTFSHPTGHPTKNPTPHPTAHPTAHPTKPTAKPTTHPTTPYPTRPGQVKTDSPTPVPTVRPTKHKG